MLALGEVAGACSLYVRRTRKILKIASENKHLCANNSTEETHKNDLVRVESDYVGKKRLCSVTKAIM